MTQIRRVKAFDGGNHLLSDVLQIREGKGQKWLDVEVIDSHEAQARDLEEGIESIDDIPHPNARGYWRAQLRSRAEQNET